MSTHDSPEAALAAALKAAGWEPDFNVCASCGHGGGDHDLGNWCLICPRPDVWNREGWCYFASMTDSEKWEHGIAAILAAMPGWTLVPTAELGEDRMTMDLMETAIRKDQAEIARLRGFLSDIAKMPENRGYDPSPQGIARFALLTPATSERVHRCNCPESGTSGSCPFHDNSTVVAAADWTGSGKRDDAYLESEAQEVYRLHTADAVPDAERLREALEIIAAKPRGDAHEAIAVSARNIARAALAPTEEERPNVCPICKRTIVVEAHGGSHPSPGDHDPAPHVARSYGTEEKP